MIRTFVLGLALTALALPAAAASVTVNVANLDIKTAHAKITEAAGKVCRAEMAGASPLELQYGLAECIDESAAAAEAKLAERRTTLAKL